MNPILTVTLEGKNAKEAAEQLVLNSNGAARKRTHEIPIDDHRAVDYVAIVDFFRDVAPIATTFAATIVTANFIAEKVSNLRKKTNQPLEITIVININGTVREIPVYEDLTKEDIEVLIKEIDEELYPPK